jgi:hypothetical protein
VNTLLIVVPVGLSFTVLTLKGIGTLMQQGTKKRGLAGWLERLFQSAKKQSQQAARELAFRSSLTVMRAADDLAKFVKGDGQLSLSFTGTAAANIGAGQLASLEAGGLESMVGPILLNDLSKLDRDAFLRKIPPVFLNRITQVSAQLKSGGMGGASIGESLEEAESWMYDEVQAATRYAEAIRRQWAATNVGGEFHFAGLSSAGSAVLGRPALEILKERCPDLPLFGYVSMDHKDIIRQRWPEVWEYYGQLLQGLIVTDAAREQERNEVGINNLLTGLVGGVWLSAMPLGPLNILSLLCPKNEPGHIVMLSTETMTVPAFERVECAEKLGTVWYTNRTVVLDTLLKGIKRVVTESSLQSLGMNAAALGTPRGLCVLLPIVPEHALPIVREAEARIKPWLWERDRNIVLQFASIGQHINREHMTGEVIFIFAQRVDGGAASVAEYVNETLIGPAQAVTITERNGHKPKQNRKTLANAKALPGGKKQ